MNSELHWLDATDTARAIQDRQVTASEVLEHYLARVRELNPKLNCIVALDERAARKRAREADAALANGQTWGPLHGVPMTIKDTFEVAGMPCTAGSELLRDHVPHSHATAVQHFIDAGAIVFGKTNVPPFAADLQTRNTLHGTTGNAWNPDRIAGGSSGGSAVALAAGLTALELGSDIGGSSRNPAHYNNVFGMRPSWGTLSGIGHIPGPPGDLVIEDFGSPGPMARSARDLRLAFDLARGSDPHFGVVLKPAMPESAIASLSELRVALWLNDELAPVESAVRDVHERALRKLTQAGMHQSQEARPDFDAQEAFALYSQMGSAITGQGIPEGEREQMRQRLQVLEACDASSREAERLRGVLASFAQYRRWDNRRGFFRKQWHHFFQRFDVLLTPIIGVSAREHGENFFTRTIQIDGRDHIGWTQLFWAAPQVLANLPSVVFPAGFTDEGLPVGLQVTAPYLHDYRAIDVAGLMADAIGALHQHPQY